MGVTKKKKKKSRQSKQFSYEDSKQPGAYAGASTYLRQNRVSDKKQFRKWLKGQEAYTLHYPVKKNFQRRRTLVFATFEQWQADLCDLSRLQSFNSGYRYLLTVIDVFSKVAYVRPLKTKTGPALVKAFKDIFKESPQTPGRLQTDAGTEFLNAHVQRLFKRKNIHFFVTHNSETKAAVVERFNRTLKGRMYRFMTHNNTSRYIDDLQSLVDNYNATYHRSIRMQPQQVGPHNHKQVYMNLFGDSMRDILSKDKPAPKVVAGDRVRLGKARRTFHKGYLPAWTQELFTIDRQINKVPPYVYRVRDDKDVIIKGTFYEPELQKIEDSGVYKIEKVLRRRGGQLYVKWLNYSEDFNSWIPAASVQTL